MFSSKAFKLVLLLLVLLMCVQQSQAGFKGKYKSVKKVAKKSVQTILKPIDQLTHLILSPFKKFLSVFKRSTKEDSLRNESKDQKKKKFFQKLKHIVIRITNFLFRYFLNKYRGSSKIPIPQLPLPFPDIISDIIINRKSNNEEDGEIIRKIGNELLEVEDEIESLEDFGEEIKKVIEEEVKEEVARINKKLARGEEDEDEDEGIEEDRDDGIIEDDEKSAEENDNEEENKDEDESDNEDKKEASLSLVQSSLNQKNLSPFSNGQIAAQVAVEQKNQPYWAAFEVWDKDVNWLTRSSAVNGAKQKEVGPIFNTVVPDFSYVKSRIAAQSGAEQKNDKNGTNENLKKSFWLKNHKTQDHQVAVEDKKNQILAAQVAVEQESEKNETKEEPKESIWFRKFEWGKKAAPQVAVEQKDEKNSTEEIPKEAFWFRNHNWRTRTGSQVAVEQKSEKNETKEEPKESIWFRKFDWGKKAASQVAVEQKSEKNETKEEPKESIWFRKFDWGKKAASQVAVEQKSEKNETKEEPKESIWFRKFEWGKRAAPQVAVEQKLAEVPKFWGKNHNWRTRMSAQVAAEPKIYQLGNPSIDLNVWDKRDKKNTPMPSVFVEELSKEDVLEPVPRMAQKQNIADELWGRWPTRRPSVYRVEHQEAAAAQALNVAASNNHWYTRIASKKDNEEVAKQNGKMYHPNIWDKRNKWNTKIPSKFIDGKAPNKPVPQITSQQVYSDNTIWSKDDDWTTGLMAAAQRFDGQNDDWYTQMAAQEVHHENSIYKPLQADVEGRNSASYRGGVRGAATKVAMPQVAVEQKKSEYEDEKEDNDEYEDGSVVNWRFENGSWHES